MLWPRGAWLQLSVYLDASCTPTSALTPYLVLTTSQGLPYANQKVYAYAMTGASPCMTASLGLVAPSSHAWLCVAAYPHTWEAGSSP